MAIQYKSPLPSLAIQDDGYQIATDVETINLGHSLSVGTSGSGQATIDGYLKTQNVNIFVADAYIYNFSNEFTVATDGYGKANISLSDDANRVSPGFTWGRSGNIVSGAYLQNDTVPSNLAGRLVSLDSYIVQIFVANENANTFSVTIQKRTGPGTFLDLVTVSLVAERSKTIVTSVFVANGDELAAYVSVGSAKNPVVGLVLQGV